MTFSEAITELEDIIERFDFKDCDAYSIPPQIVTALVARHSPQRWEIAASRVENGQITPAEYLKEMLEMLEIWMRKRFMSQVLTKFSKLERA